MAKGKSKAKATKTFLKKGLLDGQIKKRHEARAFKQKVTGRAVQRNKGGKARAPEDEDEGDEADIKIDQLVESDSEEETGGLEGELNGEDGEDDEGASDLEEDDLSDLDEAEGSDDDDEDEDGHDDAQHVADLKALALKDPEFFKYLQENDKELLDFGGEDDDDDEDGEDEDEEMAGIDDDEKEDEEDSDDEGTKKGKSKKGKGKGKAKVEAPVKKTPVLTKQILKTWQTSLLKTRSIRSLRKLLIAFAAAASSGGAGSTERRIERWEIQSSTVFNKLIITTLKYTPVILAHHVPYKEVGSSGKFKLSTNSKSYATIQRFIKSYFHSLNALLNSVQSDSGIPALAVTESVKLIPWIVGNRKVARGWVKMLLNLYNTAADEVRVAAFIALRQLAVAADHALRESIIKGVYTTLLSSSRATTIYTLPSLTLMKNSASEIFLLPGKNEGELSYQLCFGYIRMLAILLRKGVKDGSKDSFKSVYNWQFVHAIDFWSLVVSSACDKSKALQGKAVESPLVPLLYPLIQVALGAIRLVPTSRYYPLRFHLVRSLLRIVQRTGTYIPLSAPLFEVLSSPDLSRRSKPSTLKPLDWEYYLRCPTAYQKTRVYADGLADELVYLLTDYYGALSKNIAFPELSLPAIVALKRHAKKTGQARLGNQIKVLVEKLEGNAKWIEERREKISYAPGQRDQIDRFLLNDESVAPLSAHLKLQKKLRDQKRMTLEKAAQGHDDQ